MPNILAFIPAYNCQRQIARTLAQFDASVRPYFAELIVVDNRSTDDTVAVATASMRQLTGLPCRLLRNDANYGLGGSHKVAFDYALDNGFDYCVVLHGDDQASVKDLLPHLDRWHHLVTDCLLGARFMPGARLSGYSRFRTLGNRVFNLLYSAAARRRLHDLGSGLNLYATAALRDRFYARLADDLTFNYELILSSCARDWRMQFFPIEWREEDQRSNVKLFRQAWRTAGIAADFVRDRETFVRTDRSRLQGAAYTWTTAFDSATVDARQPAIDLA